jgi:hypothetical protein
MAWIGNGLLMPASASASVISVRISKSVNSCVGAAAASSSVTVIVAEVLSSSAACGSAATAGSIGVVSVSGCSIWVWSVDVSVCSWLG